MSEVIEAPTLPDFYQVIAGKFVKFGSIIQTVEIGKLNANLAKAQGEVLTAVFNAKGNYGAFANLESIIEAIRVAFAKYGISVSQTPVTGEFQNRAYLITRIAFEDQWIMSECSIACRGPDMFSISGGTTYLKRMVLSAIARVGTGEDDDGHFATTGKPLPENEYNEVKTRTQEKPKEPPKPLFNMPTRPTPPIPNHAPSKAAPTPDKSPTVKPPPPDQKEKPQHPSVDQIRKLFAVASEKDIGPDKLKQILEMGMGIEATTQMTQQQWQSLVDLLQSGYNNVESIIKELKK